MRIVRVCNNFAESGVWIWFSAELAVYANVVRFYRISRINSKYKQDLNWRFYNYLYKNCHSISIVKRRIYARKHFHTISRYGQIKHCQSSFHLSKTNRFSNSSCRTISYHERSHPSTQAAYRIPARSTRKRKRARKSFNL